MLPGVICMAAGEHAVYTLKPCKKRLTERGKLEGSTFDAAGNEVRHAVLCCAAQHSTRPAWLFKNVFGPVVPF